MKVTIEYDLPDDEYEYFCSKFAVPYALALEDIIAHLRERIKYGELSDEAYGIYEAIYEKVYSIMDEHKAELSGW